MLSIHVAIKGLNTIISESLCRANTAIVVENFSSLHYTYSVGCWFYVCLVVFELWERTNRRFFCGISSKRQWM